jgi:hypothetical protein
MGLIIVTTILGIVIFPRMDFILDLLLADVCICVREEGYVMY